MATHTLTGRHGAVNDAYYHRHGHTQAPLLVQWMATLRCRLTCPHCMAAGAVLGQADMPLPAVRGLIDQVAGMGVEEFLITGGEPLVREDLPEVIEHLGRRGQRWSLNTAVMPAAAQRRAMRDNPPGFVAVSIDGPPDVHDAFRGRTGSFAEAVEAIGFFASLPGCRVVAGTTLTQRNFNHLGATRAIVAASGADGWGLHLLVPEGRAAGRTDLDLSCRQKRRLLNLVAQWRRTMDVNLADELGYVGPGEPLVRNSPWRCGAGRTQAVVLPGGQLVPCNTLDVTTSAGNVLERPLADIWAGGFAELRNWRPAGKCRACEHAAACGGGCWLHRRAGTHCSKDVWTAMPFARTAAGVMLCLTAAAGGARAAEEPQAPTAAAGRGAPPGRVIQKPDGARLEEAVLRHYMGRIGGRVPPQVDAGADDVPAYAFLRDFAAGKLDENLTARCERVRKVLATEPGSLAFTSLLWRSVTEPAVAGDWPAAGRTAPERALLADVLAALQRETTGQYIAWLQQQIGVFNANGGRLPHPLQSKAYVPGEHLLALQHRKRAGLVDRSGHAGKPLTADVMALQKTAAEWRARMELRIKASGGRENLALQAGNGGKTTGEAVNMGPFDVLQLPPAATAVEVTISCPAVEDRTWQLTLPAGTTLTWGDVLNAFDRAHGVVVRKEIVTESGVRPPADNPLYLPVMRELAEPHSADVADAAARQMVLLWLADLWLM